MMIKNKQGFSLMETMVALAVFALITTSLYTLFTLGIKIVNEDKARVGGRVLAEQKMEIIKNLAYTAIGTVGGVPAGSILPEETINLNTTEYTINTDIHYYDDSYDGVAPVDTVNIDYKKIRIQVSWDSQFNSAPIVLVCDIVPKDRESLIGGGTLWLEVYDSTPSPVAGATVQIINNDVFPAVNITSATNAQGVYSLPGALASTQSYQVIISKPGYSTIQTYSVDLENNPNPDPAHLSVGDGDVTNKMFIINPLADFQIRAKLESGEPVAGFSFGLQGDEIIGTDGDGNPLYKYDQEYTTAADGTLTLTELNPQIYKIIFDPLTTGYDLAGYSPSLPYQLAPDSAGTVDIVLAPHATNSLLVTVKVGLDAVQADVPVRLYNLVTLSDQTKTTNASGQVFFTPLDSGTYNLEIIQSGFDPVNIEVNSNGQVEQQILLSAI